MQEYQSETTTELAKALLSVQKLLQPATKDATNPFVKKRYASLNSIMDVCREPLISNGIWLCQYPVPVPIGNLGGNETGQALGLVTKLTHAESGQWQASLSVIPLPKADPQGMGSAITYARRYALSAMLGIVTEDDFDGEQNKQFPQRQQARRENPPRPPQNQNDNHNQQHMQQGNSGELPMLNGVIYESIETTDEQGVLRETIIAKGNTIPNKGFLMQEGFRWNPQQKHWWKFANVA